MEGMEIQSEQTLPLSFLQLHVYHVLVIISAHNQPLCHNIHVFLYMNTYNGPADGEPGDKSYSRCWIKRLLLLCIPGADERIH